MKVEKLKGCEIYSLVAAKEEESLRLLWRTDTCVPASAAQTKQYFTVWGWLVWRVSDSLS